MLKTTRSYFQKFKCTKSYRLQQLRPRASPSIDTTVLYDYVDLYMKYICIHDAQQCIPSAIFPPLQEQIKIVQDFNTIVHDIGKVHDLQGIILKLLITHDDNALATLTERIQDYNNSIDMIQTIIEYANTLPLPSNEHVVHL